MHDDDRDSALSVALRKVAEEDLAGASNLAVETRLLEEVRAIARARRRRARVTVFALAAAVALAAGATLWRSTPQPPATPPPVRAEIVTPFYPLIHSAVPLNGGRVVRMQVSRRALASFGLASPGQPGASSGTVLADVIVGEDGLARAVRFVQPATDEGDLK